MYHKDQSEVCNFADDNTVEIKIYSMYFQILNMILETCWISLKLTIDNELLKIISRISVRKHLINYMLSRE